jgi:hypothetical protein
MLRATWTRPPTAKSRNQRKENGSLNREDDLHVPGVSDPTITAIAAGGQLFIGAITAPEPARDGVRTQ